ncbi:phosphatidate cytidylyltransferase [bacterium]|nr:phosphatidate cytidylyltransferase [bacterium]
MASEKHDPYSLLKRVLVAIVFVPVLLWLFWTGGYPFFVFLAVITAFGQWELFGMFSHRLRFPHRAVGFIAGMLIVTSASFGYTGYCTGIIVLSLIGVFTIEIVSGKDNKLEAVLLTLFATVYPSCCNVFLMKLSGYRYYEDFTLGRHILLYVLVVIWIFDTASYFSGRQWGKHPFFQGISPKKTAEGFFGGLAGVVLLGIAAAFFVENSYIIHLFVITILAALAGQAGDLSESVIKRDRGVKDSSRIIPGHGGVLDRFDSLFFAAPVVYIYLTVVFHFSGGHF